MSASTALGRVPTLRPDGRRRVRCVVLLDGCPPHVGDGDGHAVAGGADDASGARTLVVLDDACERLERIASDGMGRGPLGAWQRRTLLRSLRAAEPDDGDAIELLPLGRNATRDARACLVRTRATPAATASLEAFAADGARLACVTTVARLLARVYGRHPVPRLFVARTPADERHVLVVDGVACFSRTVARPDASTDASTDASPERVAAAVADSLEHLAGRYAAGVVDVAGVGLDDASLDACRKLARVGEVRRVSGADLATTLAARLAERAGPTGVRRRTAHVPALLRDASFAGRGRDGRRGRVALAVAIASCLAVGSAGRALATYLRADGLDASIASERQALEHELAAELGALDALHERPFEAAASLERAGSLRAGAPPGAGALLTLVANALRDHEAVRIDSIAWSASPPDRDDPYGDATVADAVFTDASALPVRAPDPFAGRGAGLDAELAGRVVGATGVGAAERVVDGFASALEAMPGVRTVTRLDSPLERAAGGAAIGAATGPDASSGDAGDGATWRLRFALDGRSLGS